MTEAPNPLPPEVIEAVRLAFDDWEAVLLEMRWSSIDGCWFIRRYGMTIGIETDGYIHS